MSIIIPYFNSIQFLEKLLCTIPNVKDLEVIVVDDKSTENVNEYNKLAKQPEFNHVQFLCNLTSKKGAGICRNIGIKNATGKWLLFADSDDYFTQNFYEVIKKYFETTYDVIFFRPTSVYYPSGKIANRHIIFEKILLDYYLKSNLKNELSLRYEIPNPYSKMIRREFILKNKIFFDEVIASNDVMFSTKVGYHMKHFKISNEIIYCITKSQGTLTVDLGEDKFWSRIKVNVDYYRYLKSNLTEKEFNMLKPKTLGYLINSTKYGFKSFLKALKIYRENNVKWFYFSYLNPFIFCIKLYRRISSYYKNKKYYVK